MLELKNISKAYSGKQIIKDVSFKIEPGKITVLLGPSGAGKTTLLRSASLIEKADSGSISFFDRTFDFPTKENIPREVWPDLTVVFQQLFLWPHLTLRENILLPARKRRTNPEKELAEAVQALNMQEFIDRYPNQVSIGQRQRVALARAIILKSKIILMDEITSALDIEQIASVLDFLPKLKERGAGVMIITHHLNFAKRIADNFMFLDNGEILESAEIQGLNNPKSERLKSFLSVMQSV